MDRTGSKYIICPLFATSGDANHVMPDSLSLPVRDGKTLSGGISLLEIYALPGQSPNQVVT